MKLNHLTSAEWSTLSVALYMLREKADMYVRTATSDGDRAYWQTLLADGQSMIPKLMQLEPQS